MIREAGFRRSGFLADERMNDGANDRGGSGMFRDRTDAGRRLGEALRPHAIPKPVVLGIPRGGVRVAFEIGQTLDCAFSILIVRKLPFPDNPESGFGAVAEDGSVFFTPKARDWVSPAAVAVALKAQRKEVARRVRTLRGDDPLPPLAGRHVLIVDDGVAMGSTLRAAVICCRNLGALRITAAAPVMSRAAMVSLKTEADAVVTLLAPPGFRAVADYYEAWYDVPDSEVLDIMREARESGRLAR